MQNCPECKNSVSDEQFLVKPCKKGHFVCQECMKEVSENGLNSVKQKCWLLGKNCSSDLHHFECVQCGDKEAFHIPENTFSRIAKVKDVSHNREIGVLKRSCGTKLDEIKIQCRKSETDFQQMANTVQTQLSIFEAASLTGNVVIAAGIIATPSTLGLSSLLTVAGVAITANSAIIKMKLSENAIENVKKNVSAITKILQKLLDAVHECNIRLAVVTVTDPKTGKLKVPPNSDVQSGIFHLSMVVGGVRKFDYIELEFITNLMEILGKLIDVLDNLFPLISMIKNFVADGKFTNHYSSKICTGIQNAIKELEKLRNVQHKDLF